MPGREVLADTSLFDALAMGHPERLVQGAFGFALRTRPQFAKRVLEHLSESETIDSVWHEEKTATGWRADTIAVLAGGKRVRFELKLAAAATERQQSASEANVIAAAIVPDGRRFASGSTRTIAWSTIAEWVNEPFLEKIFREANDSASWARNEIDLPTALRSFGGFLASETWRELYAFLVTVDAHLVEDMVGYAPSRGWSMSRVGKWKYYGFSFDVEGTEFWIGFAREKSETTIRLRLRNETKDQRLDDYELPLDAKAVASLVLARIRP